MSRWWLERLRSGWSRFGGSAAELHISDLRSEAIADQFQALDLPPHTRLTCVVGGEGVRYQLVPWRDELSRPAQRQLLAEQCFSDTYGDVARHWRVVQNATRYGAATLACAIDTAALDQLTTLSQARRIQLVSVQPALMHAYNAVRAHMSPGVHGLAVIGADWTTLLLLSPTEPLWVQRWPSPGLDLAAAIDRAWFALGIEPQHCAVYVVRTDAMPIPVCGAAAASWSFVDLTAHRPTPHATASDAASASVALA